MAHTPGELRSRASWGARPPKATTPIGRVVTGSTAHWEGPGMGAYGPEKCDGIVRGIQNYHMNHQGWSDVAYTNLVCRHGVIYEGRGWGLRSAANGTNVSNNSSYAHCVIMGQGDEFTAEAQFGLRTIYDLARSQGGAGSSQNVHHDWFATQCPGAAITHFVRVGLPVSGYVPPAPGTRPPPASPGQAVPFPYPSGHYLGRPSPDPYCHSGYYGEPDHSNVRTWQTQMIHRGWYLEDGADGFYGKDSASLCAQFQAEKGLKIDSKCGKNTWTASFIAPIT